MFDDIGANPITDGKNMLNDDHFIKGTNIIPSSVIGGSRTRSRMIEALNTHRKYAQLFKRKMTIEALTINKRDNQNTKYINNNQRKPNHKKRSSNYFG